MSPVGLAQVRVELDKNLRKKVADLIDDDVLLLAEAAAARARETAPVATGDFVASIKVERHAKAPAGWRVGSDDPAAAAIEYGTYDTPEHHTIRSAVEEVVGPFATRPYVVDERHSS